MTLEIRWSVPPRRLVHTTNGMTPDQLEAYGYDEMTKLERVYGKSLDKKLHAAAVMIHDLDLITPGLKNLFRGHWIGDNALIVA